ncbi:MAG: Crp/Fnr family transcriptional regulator [Rhodobacteraceae bacterium]|nr:MAG: Crp/Fnr family transcriptional regulator [Paracoccaceae bacterium]
MAGLARPRPDRIGPDPQMPLQFRDTARRESLILGALSAGERAALLALSKPCHYPGGKAIFSKGSRGETMMLIETGRVEISLTSASGNRSIVAHLGPGDSVGEMAILLNSERTADALATNDVTGRLVHRTHLMNFLAEHPKTTLGLIADLCRKLQATTEALADLSMADGGTRLAKVLIGLFDRWGIEEAEGWRLTPPVSQSDLGDMAGLTRETVNRQIRAWEQEGMLRRDGRELILLDADKLDARAH